MGPNANAKDRQYYNYSYCNCTPKMLGQTCNGKIFYYQGNQIFQYIFIGLTAVVLLFLLIKMMQLCSIAFSYSNFHVHQTYKLYALAIVNLSIIAFSRKTQVQYKQFQQKMQEEGYKDDVMEMGYQLVNDIFGILSIYTNNYMHLYNGFTWLLISLSCDYTTNKEREDIQENQLAAMTEDFLLKSSKEVYRKRIGYLKNYLINCLLWGMLALSLFGTIDHREGDPWCTIVTVLIVTSSFLPLIVFVVALLFYAKRFWDPQVSLKTKCGLIYLLVAMIIRVLYFMVSALRYNNLSFGGDWLSLAYMLFCTLFPIFVMSLLGEMQLKDQRYTLLRRSSLIFRSTVI